jgi:hypothetical protein
MRDVLLDSVLHMLSCLHALAEVDDRIIAVTNGWVDPVLKYMHCEALQVFTRGLKGDEGDRLRGGPRGLGLYVGVATFAFAHSKGCKRAEILAINDDGALLYARLLYCCHFTCDLLKLFFRVHARHRKATALSRNVRTCFMCMCHLLSAWHYGMFAVLSCSRYSL